MRNWIMRTLLQAAWAPLIVFTFYAIAAKGYNAYIMAPWLDMPTHFFGGMAMTYFYTVVIKNSQSLVGLIPRLIQMFLSIGLIAITAILWEFLEYASDFAINTKMNLGVSDTLSDLFFGLFGGVIFVTANSHLSCRRLLGPKRSLIEARTLQVQILSASPGPEVHSFPNRDGSERHVPSNRQATHPLL